MTHQQDVREFLSSRRARITPEQAGLPAYGGGRRVSGLRREEVALLAGMSVDYYVRLERGNLSGASDAVLKALGRALKLDESESAYLFDLARKATGPAAKPRRTRAQQVRPSVQQILDAIVDLPAWVRNDRYDMLATNRMARALHAPMLADPRSPVNVARFVYLDPAARTFFPNWDRMADENAAMLRQEAARHPLDKGLTELIGELSTRSDEFRQRWAAHDVRLHRSGTKRLHHPVVGDLELNFDSLDVPSDPGLTMIVYTAAPGSTSADALALLGSWAAEQERTTPATERDERTGRPTG
ncbi:helix-turn-helix domain-containing protein [Promicromonospora sp. NPDC090134]|uniref:helix-turn-helix domain-containing protein n=1 Tax=Promicromonospora sp. NPDC090134 TaxID=3364408 RepID=UPI003813AF06